VNAAQITCLVCQKAVFKMEEMMVDKMTMHKACFQCSHCKRVLSLGNFTMANGQLFCKPHYIELFKNSGGKYEAAFGDSGFEKKAERAYTPPSSPGSGTRQISPSSLDRRDSSGRSLSADDLPQALSGVGSPGKPVTPMQRAATLTVNGSSNVGAAKQ
jgi:hypothetical protein